MFPVIPVNSQNENVLEQVGTKRKYWFDDGTGKKVLFKAECRGTGEDWAEKLSCKFCELLGLPHATYDLAKETRTGTPGVISETFLLPMQTLVMGSHVLLKKNANYPENERYKLRQHTVRAVEDAIADCERPLPAFTQNLPMGISTASDVFVGYVMLDAWIANQDRHHENWALVYDENDLRYLAPTYDHGASLARNLTDEDREDRLSTSDSQRKIPAFCRKARSAFYGQETDVKPLFTFDAWLAFAKNNPLAAGIWKQCLCGITDENVYRLIDEVPADRMSNVCREFTFQLLMENRKRILEGDTDE